MNRSWVVVIIVVIILLAGGFYLMSNRTTVTPEDNQTETMLESSPDLSAGEKVFELSEQNESSESGTAVLTEKDGQLTVVLNMTGAPEGIAQPAHIHAGACPTPGEVIHPLTNVTDGNSETVIATTIDDLKSQLPLAINVHKSAAESGVYVACGDLSF